MASRNDIETRREKERERLTALIAKRPQKDDDFAFTGVLLDDAIKQCVDSFDLIRPFSLSNLKPANYKLRIGNEYALKGQIWPLHDTTSKNQIIIEPFDVAVIKTLETINMPRFLIARWNIRVQLAYEGLLWVGGPQVDAGYVGHLFCPIYNLSDKPVTLTYGDPIAVIDFVRTTEFHEGISKPYPDGVPERILFEDYSPEKLRSALATHVVSKINQFGESIERVQNRMDNFTSITFAVLGLLIAAVTLAATKPGELRYWWDPSAFWICALAVFVSLIAWINSLSSGGWLKRRWKRTLVEIGIFALAVSSIIWFSVHTQQQTQDLTRKVQVLQERLDHIATPRQ